MKPNVKKDRTRNWMTVVYPDSAPANWEDVLSERLGHGPWAHSPLHDSDTNPDGTTKKPHWHVIITFPGVKTYEQVKEILEPLHCADTLVLHNVSAMIRYFTHVDNPEKAQYSRDDIKAFGGLDVRKPYEDNADFEEAQFSSLFKIIKETRICNLITLEEYLVEVGNDDLRRFVHTHTFLAKSYLDSMYQLNKSQHYNAVTGEVKLPGIEEDEGTEE